MNADKAITATKLDLNRSHREDLLIAEIERLRALLAVWVPSDAELVEMQARGLLPSDEELRKKYYGE